MSNQVDTSSNKPQIEDWINHEPSMRVVSLQVPGKRIVVGPKFVSVMTKNGPRPATREDLNEIHSAAPRRSKERQLIDIQIPPWRRLTGKYSRTLS